MLKSKLKAKRRDGLLLAVLYIIVGAAQIMVLATTNFALFTSGILAVLSFIAAYGLFTVKKWSIWLVVALFFPQFVFGVVTLYASILSYAIYQEIAFALLNTAPAVIVIVLSFITFMYVAAKRESFKQA